MHPEISTAAIYISTLLTSSPPDSFQTDLTHSLAALYSKSWYTEDPERGSAARALHCQPGPGGEGCSSVLLETCKRHNFRLADKEWTMWIDPGCVAIRVGPGPGRSAPALSSLNNGPTLPGCQDGLKVIYGALATATRSIPPMSKSMHSPLVTLAAPGNKAVLTRPTTAVSTSRVPVVAVTRVPSVTVSPSSPALDIEPACDTTPLVPWTQGDGSFAPGRQFSLQSRRRRGTDASDTSSTSSRRDSAGSDSFSHLSLGREESPEASSSIGTSIPATSPPTSASWIKLDFPESVNESALAGSDNAKAGTLPQETSIDPVMLNQNRVEAPAASNLDVADKCAPLLVSLDLHGLGLEDCGLDDTDIGPDDAVSAQGGDDDDVEDEIDAEGDDTIRSLNEGDETVCPIEESEKASAPAAAPVLVRSSASSASSVTSFDNGNVGVLGGGVKLGGSSASSTVSRSRSRAMSTTSSVSNFSSASSKGHGHYKSRSVMSRTGGWAAQQQEQLQQHQAHYHHDVVQAPNALGLSNVQAGYHPQATLDTRPSAQVFNPAAQNFVAKASPSNDVPATSSAHQLLSKRRLGPFSASLEISGRPTLQLQNGDSAELDTPRLGDNLPLPSPALSSSSSLQTDSSEGIDGEREGSDEQDDDLDKTGSQGKRTRTRGRRSRGRGAGRAARRAAAAALAGGNSPALPSPVSPAGHWQFPVFQPQGNGFVASSMKEHAPQFDHQAAYLQQQQQQQQQQQHLYQQQHSQGLSQVPRQTISYGTAYPQRVQHQQVPNYTYPHTYAFPNHHQQAHPVGPPVGLRGTTWQAPRPF